MTVSSSTSKVSYNGNGSTTVFAYTFKVFDQDDLTVIVRSSTGTETTQTITTNYTVSGVGDANGGNVTMVTAPASGETLTILREQPLTQGLDLVPNDPFPAGSMEDSLDKLTFMVQTHEEEIARSIKASKTNTITSTEFTVSAADRANKVFGFDGSGELAVTQELGTFRGDWGASTAYAVRDLVKDTSTNNIFICVTAHTSSGSQPLTTNTDSAKWNLIVDAAAATTSATNAAASAAAAATSETNAGNSATAAASSQSAAATSASNASTSETNAASSASAASTSETNAAASETAAGTSETNAATSATAASNSASAAATSASNAATSESNASTSQGAAATSATNAATSAATATTKAGEASTSATNAATSETNAGNSATASASSASAAATSETNAANSAAAAAAAFDNFDDTYLGSKTSDPTVDNDGNALVSGALYFNSTANEMRVYDGANWIAASSAGTASLILYEYTATSGQTTFSGADDNSASLSYAVGNLQVVMNGVVLDPSDFTATSGTSVVLASGAATGDLINIYAFKSFTVADTVSASAGGTFAGNVTFAGAFTSQGIDDNATSTAMTLDSSGNLLVGTAVTDGGYDDADGGATATFMGASIGGAANGTAFVSRRAAPLQLNRQANNGSISEFRKDGSTVGIIGADGTKMYTGSGATGLHFNRDDASIEPYNPSTIATRDAAIDLGSGDERFKDLYLSGGIYLGGVGAANKLDDYEEGTFTPSFGYSSNGTHSSTFAQAVGYYTKIGRVVHCSIFLQWSSFSKGTASGQARILNLPFTSLSSVRSIGSGGWQAYNYNADTSKQFTLVVQSGDTHIDLNDVGANTLNDQINDPNNGSEFKIFVTYFTS
jgi:hypothetical protein